MRSVREIQKEISELKREMKANKIPISSFLNRQPSRYAAKCNEDLYRLKLELEEARKQAP